MSLLQVAHCSSGLVRMLAPQQPFLSRSCSHLCRNSSPVAVSRFILARSTLAVPTRRFSNATFKNNLFIGFQQASRSSDWNNALGNEVTNSTVRGRTAEAIWSQKSKEALKQLVLQPPAGPYAGRTVKVYGGNVADAYGRLEGLLRRNRVKREIKLTERHEKKGVKRRRLRSERWRRQFANEVRKKVALVASIRKRGA